jgi:pyruvate formate lyase activating enzyme
MQGLIFSVKRYSVHDGPGIRVTFFMKGCPLSCIWCHNPEGISPFPERVLKTNKVGDKEFICEEEAGRWYSVPEVIGIIDRERPFISQSDGGVTFSGGEPMMQTEFLTESLKACKSNGYHTVIDTSGYSSGDNYRSVIPFTDLFLFDLKHMDDVKHRAYTGVSNIGILDNYRILTGSGKDIMVRIPVIPAFNDDPENLEKLKYFIMSCGTDTVKKINLLPFHKIGSSKYKRFNRPYSMEGIEPPWKEKMERIKKLFIETGIPVKIGG